MRPGSGGAGAERRIHHLDAYSRGLSLRYAKPFKDVERLPEQDPCRVGLPPRGELGFSDPFEDLALLVGVADLPGQFESGLVMIKGVTVPT